MSRYTTVRYAPNPQGWSTVASNNVQAMKNEISYKPVSIAISANNDVFRYYSSGTITVGKYILINK
jgi:hypothetical protein